MGDRRILIVGGGIAGLAAAAELQRAGVACEVVERTGRWAPVGAGLVLSVTAMAVLRRLGVADALVARGAVLGRGAITDASGHELMGTDFAALRGRHGPTVAVHRAVLHELLLAAADGVPIAMGTSVDALADAGDHVEVLLTDGRHERYDAVVGADGVRSRVRQLVFGDVPLRYAGYTCWRVVVPAPAGGAELREMWGRGRRFGIVPLGDGRLYAFAVLNAPPGLPDPPEGRVQRLRERFAGFGGQVPAILAALDDAEALVHDDLGELARRCWHQGRVALLGDAAHALTPNLGQGAAMALEDARVLVDELQGAADPARAFALYATRREPRVHRITEQSRRLGELGQIEGRVTSRLRNALLRLVPRNAGTRTLEKIADEEL